MAREIRISVGESGSFGTVSNYQVREDATSLTIGDSQGGVGSIGFATAPVTAGPFGKRSMCQIGVDFTLTDRITYDDDMVVTGVAVGAVDRINYAVDPYFIASRGATTGYVRPMTNRFTGTNGTYAFYMGMTDGPVGIQTYGRYTVGTSTGSGRGFNMVGNPEAVTPSADYVPVTQGEPLALSIYSRYSDALTRRLTLRWLSAPGVWLNPAASWTSTSPNTPNTWFRHSVSGLPPAGAVGFQAYVTVIGTSPTNATIDATGILHERGTTTINPVFSGADQDGTISGFKYDWQGAAYLTASTRAPIITSMSPKTLNSAVSGRVTGVSVPFGRASFDAETILTRLNVERTAKSHYGLASPPTVSSSLRTNLAINPGFELGVTNVEFNTAAGLGNAATVSQAEGQSESGSFVARLTFTANQTTSHPSNGGGIKYWNPITAGKGYSFSAKFQVVRFDENLEDGAQAQRVRLMARWENSSGGEVSIIRDEDRIVGQGEWNYFSLPSPTTAPVGAARLAIFVLGISGVGGVLWKTGDAIDFDEVLIENEAVSRYFDGGMPATSRPGDLEGEIVNTTQAWLGAPGASASTQQVDVISPGRSYDATVGSAFRYYCSLVDIENVSVAPEFERMPVTYPAWTGNVWNKIKDLAAAVQGEVALVNGVPALRKPRQVEIPLESVEGLSTSVDNSTESQFVVVRNYRTSWGENLLAVRHDSTVSVNAAEATIVEIPIAHSLDSVNAPVPVDFVDPSYGSGTGVYSIVDSQDARVPATTWTANGGSVSTQLNGDKTAIVVTVHGMRDRQRFVGPYRLASHINPDQAALVITGSGVFIDPKEHRLRTGVPATRTSNVDGSVIDNIFIGDKNTAMTLGLRAAGRAAGSNVKLSGRISRSLLRQEAVFGIVAGARVKANDNYFRIITANISSGSIEFTAEHDAQFSDLTSVFSQTFRNFNEEYAGYKFTDFNTQWAGKTFADFNASVPRATFDDFNAIYVDAKFSDFNIFPLMDKAPTDAAPEL